MTKMQAIPPAYFSFAIDDRRREIVLLGINRGELGAKDDAVTRARDIGIDPEKIIVINMMDDIQHVGVALQRWLMREGGFDETTARQQVRYLGQYIADWMKKKKP